MPWASGAAFAKKHNHKLKGKAATKAASIANALLSKGMPEGEAIATANKKANPFSQLKGKKK